MVSPWKGRAQEPTYVAMVVGVGSEVDARGMKVVFLCSALQISYVGSAGSCVLRIRMFQCIACHWKVSRPAIGGQLDDGA